MLLRSCVILCLPLFMFKAPLILKFTEKYINDCMMYYYVCVAALIFVFVVCHIERRIELRKEETKIQSKAKKESTFWRAFSAYGAPLCADLRRSSYPSCNVAYGQLSLVRDCNGMTAIA